MENNIKIVVGSWGSYNACNKRAYGSKWLDLADYSDFDEILEELAKEGFELDGIDEELFIQDVSSDLDFDGYNFDYANVKQFVENIIESGILQDEWLYEKAKNFIEVQNFSEWLERVECKGSNWDDGIYLYEDSEYIVMELYPDLYKALKDANATSSFDFDDFIGKDDYFFECDYGLIEIAY